MTPNSNPPPNSGNGTQNADPLGGFVLDETPKPGLVPQGAAPAAVPGQPAPVGGPIADLSYRNYDGPLHTRAIRWWIVAQSGLRLTKRKRTGFWLVTAISVLPYLFMGLMLYLFSRFPVGTQNNPFIDSTPGQKYASALFRALDWQLFLLLILSLIVGASSIAGDNKSNALLVYLAKPITKTDYLLGKWMSIFILIFVVAFAPSLLLYLFCLLSYYSEGFLKEEPMLFFRMIVACAIPAAVLSSVLVGISSWSKSPSIAGAIHAGLYIATGIISLIIYIVQLATSHARGPEMASLLASQRIVNSQHASLSGVIMGLVQNAYGITIHTSTGPLQGFKAIAIPAPTLWVMLLAGIVICALGVFAAHRKIRAVEVVSG